jgi:hypothetical protein
MEDPRQPAAKPAGAEPASLIARKLVPAAIARILDGRRGGAAATPGLLQLILRAAARAALALRSWGMVPGHGACVFERPCDRGVRIDFSATRCAALDGRDRPVRAASVRDQAKAAGVGDRGRGGSRRHEQGDGRYICGSRAVDQRGDRDRALASAAAGAGGRGAGAVAMERVHGVLHLAESGATRHHQPLGTG